jgi:hypothetical protein
MQHSRTDRNVNRSLTPNQQAREPDKWQQLGFPLNRVLSEMVVAAAKVARENGGRK